MSDIFDTIGLEKNEVKDIFDKVSIDPIKLVRDYVKKPKETTKLSDDDILDLIRGEILKLPKPEPQKIVEKTVEKHIVEKPKEEPEKESYASEKEVEKLKKEIEELKNVIGLFPILDARGGSGVIGLPNPAGHGGQFASTDGSQIFWADATTGASGVINIGDPNTNGSWRIIIVEPDLEVQRLEGGVWVEKGAFSP